ncbi:hypothetical protein ACFL4C_01000 [Candidatus Omnitrophota bacterium]
MEQRLPLGVKFIAVLLLVNAAPGLLSFFPWLTELKSIELTSSNIGHIIGQLLRKIIPLCAVIGLFRRKIWGLQFSVVSLILAGISFATGLARGFVKGFDKTSPTINAVSILTGFIIAGVMVYLVIRYLYKEEIKKNFT